MTLRKYECDVLVVGGGASGLAAAIESAVRGNEVILIEKNEQVGGSTAWSVGSWTASGTEEQKLAGIEDTTEAHFEDLGKMAGSLVNRDNLPLRRILAEQTPDAIRWAKSLGVRMYGPLPEPPHRVPRMHMVLPNAKSYIYNLKRRARRHGVTIHTSTQATRLEIEGGRIVATHARTQGQDVTYAARRGVVLAGGDYSSNREMKAELVSNLVASVPGVNPTATGDCQRLVTDIGGEIVNADLAIGPILRFLPVSRRRLVEMLPPLPWLAGVMKWALGNLPMRLIRPFVMQFVTTALGPERSLFANGAKLINRDGREVAIRDRALGEVVAEQPGNEAYIVFNQEVAQLYSKWPNFISTAPGIAYAYLRDYKQARPDLYKKGASAAQLAQKLGMPGDSLKKALSGGGPFYALGPVKAYVVLTDGGVRVTEKLQVVLKNGEVIENLFGAGSTGQGGVLLEGHGHHIGWAFVSGRLAGQNVAKCERIASSSVQAATGLAVG